MMAEEGAVAIVGLGCVYPGAPDVASFWENIVAGRDAITEVPPDRIDPRYFNGKAGEADHLSAGRGGFVQGEALGFEPGRFGVMPVAVATAEPDQLLALGTASEALDDAGRLDGVSRERIGVVLGRGSYLTPGLARLDQRVRTTNQVLETLAQLLPELDETRLAEVKEAFADQLGEMHPESAIGLVPNLAASRVANRFDLGGPAYTIDAACASSLLAIDAAVSELTSRRCDAVVAGGVHHCHDVTLWSVFSQLGALSPSGEIRPYSRDADGVLISEGTGILVLERLIDALRLGHHVYATIAGLGVSSDGRNSSLMSPRVDGQVLALERAYRAARLDPSTIGLLEGHGTATPVGDRVELESIRRVYGQEKPAGEARAVLGSVKSNIGHAMPAAGAAALIKAVLAVHDGVLPPTLHAHDPNPALRDTRFRLLDQAEPWHDPAGPRRSGVNAFGFGGINAHVILEQHGARSSRARSGAARSAGEDTSPPNGFRFDAIVLEGEDAGDLAAQLAEVSGRVPPRPRGCGPARIAIVDPSPKRIELATRILAKGQPWRGRNDVWFEPSGLVTGGGRVAFLFPGIEPAFRAELDDVASWIGVKTTPMPPAAVGIERQGREMFEAGRLLHHALEDLGVVPDEIAGHSLGEWTGAFAAELIPADQVNAFLAGLEPGTLELPDVVFVAVGCGAGVASEVIAGLDGVVVSHDNCPHQSVICGSQESVHEASRRFAVRKVLAQELPFRSGFHTPFFEPYLEVVRQQWQRMPLQPPRIPLWSATTCNRYPAEPDAVRTLAAEHLIKPVRFGETVERLYEAGARVFVQLGVGSLVRFTDDTLKGRPQLSISAASPDRPGLDQLARAALALWVEGVDVRLEQLLGPGGERASGPSVARGRGPTVQLELGTQLLRLPESLTLSLDPATAPPHRASAAGRGDATSGTSPAVQAELDALLAETVSASESVAGALAAATSPIRHRKKLVTAASRASDAVQSGAAPITASGLSRESLIFDLESFPWLVDHCFYRQPDGWAELSDRFPVVPITTLIEILGQAARRMVPELTVARIENVRVMRWLSAAPPTRTTLSLKRTSAYEIEASLDGFARATIHMAAAPPPSAAPKLAPLSNPRPSPVGHRDLYSEHWMFHGPAFRGVREITALGDDGVDGKIESLPTPGAWLDNAGQLYGWWLMATADSDFLALPQSIDRIDFYGPQPPLGQIVDTSVRIVEMETRTMKADLELVWDGQLVVRIAGWIDRRFDSDAPLWLMLREPEHHLLASPTHAGYLAVEERWSDAASRELMARRYLDARERAIYEPLNPREQRLWLLGRVAAKDAVRNALWSKGHGPLFPVEVPLIDDGDHAAIVCDGPGQGQRVAFACSPWIGVAVLGPGRIYVEPIEAGEESAAHMRLVAQVAADGGADGTVHTDVLPSPVQVLPDAPRKSSGKPPTHSGGAAAIGNAKHGKGYVVARTQSK